MSENNKSNDRFLVAEQPGFSTSLVGLVIALVLGFVVRAAVNSDKLKEKMNQATRDISKEMDVELGQVRLSLSDGIFPEFAVHIQDLELNSEKTCLMGAQFQLNNLKLPIALWPLFSGKVEVKKVVIEELNLNLRKKYSACEDSMDRNSTEPNRKNETTNPREALATDSASDSEAPTEKVEPRSFPIEKIVIDKIKISYVPLSFTSIKAKDFTAQFLSGNLNKVHVNAVIEADSATLSGDYSSFADFELSYDKFLPNSLRAKINGEWREGLYQMGFDLNQAKNQATVNVELEHLPLNQIAAVFKKYKIIEKEISPQQTWISLKSSFSLPVNDLNKGSGLIESVLIDGDLGEIDVKNVFLEQLHPAIFKPYHVDVKNFSLTDFISSLDGASVPDYIESFGRISGVIDVDEKNRLMMKLENSGLELIFSNKGKRDFQLFSLILAQVKYDPQLDQNNWQIKISNMKPNEGIFIGSIFIESNKEWSNSSLKMDIDEFSFSPNVQRLMTNSGYFGAMSGSVKMETQQHRLNEINMKISMLPSLIEGVNTDRLTVTGRKSGEKFVFQFSSAELKIMQNSMASQFFNSLNFPLLSKEGTFIFTKPQLQLTTAMNSDLAWNFQAGHYDSRIETISGWDQNQNLSGYLKDSKSKMKWEIKGDRFHPQIIQQ